MRLLELLKLELAWQSDLLASVQLLQLAPLLKLVEFEQALVLQLVRQQELLPVLASL